MKKRTHLIIACILMTSSLICSAEESAINFNKIDMDALTKQNPFKPQLPEEKKITSKPTRPTGRKTGTRKPTLTHKPTGSKRTTSVQEIDQQAPEKPSITLTGLVWNTDRPQAIANGIIVDVGDTIDDKFQVVSIRKTGIDVHYKGKTTTITPSKESSDEQTPEIR